MGIGFSALKIVEKNDKIDTLIFPLTRTISLLIPILVALILPTIVFYGKFNVKTANKIRNTYVLIGTLLIIGMIMLKDIVINLVVTKERLNFETDGDLTDSDVERIKEMASAEMLRVLLYFSLSYLGSYIVLNRVISFRQSVFSRANKLKIARQVVEDTRKLAKDLNEAENMLSDFVPKKGVNIERPSATNPQYIPETGGAY